MKQKYRHTFLCACGDRFRKISTNPDLMEAKCPACKKKGSGRTLAIGDGPVSDSDLIENGGAFLRSDKYACFACKRDFAFRVEQEGDAPGHCCRCGSGDIKRMGQIMHSISNASKDVIKAMDIVANDTMKAYAMTDLNMNSTMRPGDNCAPKLPPAQQVMADGFFNHKKNPAFANSGLNLNAIGQRAIKGAYHDPNNPVALAHRAKMRPATDGRYVDATPGRAPPR